MYPKPSGQNRRWQGFKLLVVSLLAVFLCLGAASNTDELARLAKVMGLKAGDVFADVGAGEGNYAFAALPYLGPTGKVYLTELDEQKLTALKKEAAARGLRNVEVLEAGEKSTNLPDGCCDGILLRRVYHHLTAPVEIDASLLRALKQGGVLAIIDFPPRSVLTQSSPVTGVPANRGGHGIPQKIVIQELTAAGFVVDKIFNDWPEDDYCVLFRKPAPAMTGR
jgi:ubiquinone/menaquinone biosynthesis C-methylase UbiE